MAEQNHVGAYEKGGLSLTLEEGVSSVGLREGRGVDPCPAVFKGAEGGLPLHICRM